MTGPNQTGMSLWDAARALGIPFSKEVTPEVCRLQGTEILFNYLHWGSVGDQPMLLLHGRSQTAHSWDFLGLSFAEKYGVIALDQRGHGDSEWSAEADYSMEAFQRDLDEISTLLSLKRMILVGLSMGGRNAWMFASRHPELVEALVIVDSGPEITETGTKRINRFIELPDQVASYDEFVERVHQFNPRRNIEQIRGSLRHNIRQIESGVWTWKYDKVLRQAKSSLEEWPQDALWEALSKIACPTLIIRGGESDILSDSIVREMVSCIDDSRSVTIEGAGHLVPGDKPVKCIESIQEFLASYRLSSK